MIAKMTAIAFTAALASAQASAQAPAAKPAAVRNDYSYNNGHNPGYLTVTAPNIVQPAPVVAANTVVQNAASAEPTVTETVTSGASKIGSIGMSVVALAGSALAASYF
ncbi:hypothetical protein GGH12_002199 [Coemansia sp. RSA 1822]|nr:hypothetical protein LPJ76_001682 [Coemansia sp. RSA 638]KAJ2543551.1 hypothetical protein GGF49_001949 [Coemansia sp. RSA 1853]KAJ2564123.1 hypothetical protein GGH12_002199 [Coemansia sp. RSA 1822]